MTMETHFIFATIMGFYLYCVSSEFNKHGVVQRYPIPCDKGQTRIIGNMQNELLCVVQCREDKACVAVDYKEKERECEVIYSFLNTSVRTITKYDGPDVTPFIHMLMCVKQEELV